MMISMNKSKGVLTLIYGKPEYARQAVNLARSIRLRDPNLPLAVATDLDPALFEGMYDYVIPWEFKEWTGWLAKLDGCAMTPFDVTLYLDSDMLVFESLEKIFTHFAGCEFGVIGQDVTNVVWYKSMEKIRQVVPSETYPIFNGGLYYFVKGETAESVFRNAKALHAHYDELQLKRNRRMDCDQALVSLAMAQAGLHAAPIVADGSRIDAIWPNGMPVETDVIAGTCYQIEGGVRVRRGILHYYGDAMSSYNYVREEMRLRAAFENSERKVRFDALIRLRALFAWLMTPPRGIRKLRVPIERRLRSMRQG
jgi:hypothetical protein